MKNYIHPAGRKLRAVKPVQEVVQPRTPIQHTVLSVYETDQISIDENTEIFALDLPDEPALIDSILRRLADGQKLTIFICAQSQ